MAEYSTGPSTLLDSAGMTHAESLQQFNDIQNLGSVIPQKGGSRKNQRGGMDSFKNAFAPPLGVGLKQMGASRRNRRRQSQRRRRQRGGVMDMKAAYVTPPVLAGTSFSTNDESSFGYGFNLMKGAQA